MDEQEKARIKFRTIEKDFESSRKAIIKGNLEDAVQKCLKAVTTAKHMADDIYYWELGQDIVCAGNMSHEEISRHVEPIYDIIQHLMYKDRPDKHMPMVDFIEGLAYLAQRNYKRAEGRLRAAANTLVDKSKKYEALAVLWETYERIGNKRKIRETQIEAMMLNPRQDLAFKEYAEGVIRRDPESIGIKNPRQVLIGMRKILRENNDENMSVKRRLVRLDRKMIEYITMLGPEYREYRQEFVLDARTG
ncbi:hypothetical protein HY483_02105 [Candidatus Woesearchaeota archaeon]|nr:hypothetical protein [Candidatus Woesearchaeota archaeon]